MLAAADLMVHKFGVDASAAGDIPGLLPFGTMLMTPIIGLFLDYKGKSATVMIFGSILLILVHVGFAFGFITMFSNLGTLAGPAAAGAILDRSGTWPPVWALLGAVALAGSTCCLLCGSNSEGQKPPPTP